MFVALAERFIYSWPALKRAYPDWTRYYLFCLFNESNRLK